MNSSVGIVVIGRNEEKNIGAALRSALAGTEAVVYADSGSTDRSRDIARELGVEVVELEASSPFTAARGRNEGFAWLLQRWPHTEFVQFVDGDCYVEASWFECGAAFLRKHPDVGVIAGLLHERERQRNVYHRLADMEWNTAPGDVQSTGGNMLARASVWEQAGGMNAAMRAGEELDFCLRVRALGYRIVKLAEPMASHDIDMQRFGEWWSRSVRSGFAYAEGTWRRGAFGPGSQLRNVASAVAWGGALPAAAALIAPLSLGTSLVGAAGLYGVLWRRIRRYRLGLGDSREDAELYATYCVLSRFSECLGVLRFAKQQVTARAR